MSISTFANTYFHLYQFVYCPYIIIAFQFNSDILFDNNILWISIHENIKCRSCFLREKIVISDFVPIFFLSQINQL
jgi:hypothetical protein